MDVLSVLSPFLVLQVLIHEADAAEEGVLAHLVGRQDLDHPVNHLGPQGLGDGMRIQEVIESGVRVLEVAQDVVTVILGDLFRVSPLQLFSKALDVWFR